MTYCWRGNENLPALSLVLVVYYSLIYHSCAAFQLSKFPLVSARSTCKTALNESIQIWLDCRLSSSDKDDENKNNLMIQNNRLEQSNVILVSSNDQTTYPPSKHVFSMDGSKNLLRRYEGTYIRKREGMEDGSVVGRMVNIVDATGLFSALAAIGSVDWVLAIFAEDMKMIPAENLVTVAKSKGTKIAMAVEKAEDLVYLSRAMELGVDALCVPVHATDELWNSVLEAQKKRNPPSMITNTIETPLKIVQNSKEKIIPVKEMDKISLQPALVSGSAYRIMNSKSTSTVLADRVCIDLVQKLSSTEGCWIGSSADLVTLVLSEAATSSFVPSRPFRVNAGPIISHVILSDGVTSKYLCDLRPGDEVLVYDCKNGTSRSVVVGRLKIEVRPCVIVGLHTSETNDESAKEITNSHIFLQQAETVRLGKKDGQSVKVTELVTKNESSFNENQNIQGEEVLLRITNTGIYKE